MTQCLEAQFIQLEHEQTLLLEDLDRYSHILEARELKLSKYTGLEAYELSCLTGCTKVYPTDPYGVLPDGTTWLTGLEEAEADTSADTGEKKGIFRRFFSFLWSCVTKVGNAIFGSDGTKEGATVQTVLKACENLQAKSKSLVDLISSNRREDVQVQVKLPQDAKKWPDVGWILTDLKNADIMKTVAEVLRAYPTEKILSYIGAAVEHIKQAVASSGDTSFKYQQRNTSGFKELEGTIDALMSSSNVKDLARFGISRTQQGQPPACEFKFQNLAWKTAKPGEKISIIDRMVDTNIYKLVIHTNEIIKMDVVQQYRDEVRQHSRSLNKLKTILKGLQESAGSMKVADTERNAIIADCKTVTGLIMNVGKTYFAFSKMLTVILNGINKFVGFAEKAARKELETLEAAKAASNKDEKKNQGKTATWQPRKIERGL